MGKLETILYLLDELEEKLDDLRHDEKLYYDQSVITQVSTNILNAKQGLIKAIQIKDDIINDIKGRS